MIKSFSTVYNATIDWNLPSASPIETFESDFEYDAMNRLIRHTKPDLTIEEYSFNKAGLLETISVQIRGNSQPYDFITGINYNEKGQRTDVYFGNGSKTRYDYDEHTFRLTRLLTTRNTGADILQDLNYTYDPEGNIVQVTDNAQQTLYFRNTEIMPEGLYEYDPLYRLISARGRELANLQMPSGADFANNMPVPNNNDNALQNYRQVYEYDELGNILVMSSDNWRRPYFYEEGNNRLVKHDEEQTLPDYTWDAHGNMLTMPGLTEMKWDYEGRLIKSVKGDNPTYYRYDLSGNRIRKVTVKTGGIIEERLYLEGYEVFRKHISNHIDFERQTLHIDDDKKRIALVETKTIENESSIEHPVSSIRYQYDNHLGSACLELDASANIISYEEYHPFGTTSYRSGRTETEVSLKRYKYVGKERDEETGLYYYGARYYAAWIGRFVSVDLLQDKYPHYTPYQYASNKPIIAIDLDGLEAAIAIFGAGIHFQERHESTFRQEAEKEKKLNIVSEIYPAHAGKELIKTLTNVSKDENIDFLSIHSHASSRGIILDTGQYGKEVIGDVKWKNWSVTKLDDIFKNKDIKFSENALLVIAGCNAGGIPNDKDQKYYSVAQDITMRYGITAIGSVGGTRPVDEIRISDYHYVLYFKGEKNELRHMNLGKKLDQNAIDRAKSIVNPIKKMENVPTPLEIK